MSSANEQTDYLMVSNQRRPWTSAMEELRVRCRSFRDTGFGDSGIEEGLGEGKDWAFGNLTHTAKHVSDNFETILFHRQQHQRFFNGTCPLQHSYATATPVSQDIQNIQP
ncbi:unnamed protein product [Spodoptera exigua]|nr:unnamed protein product [Spodoptera exigua]